MRIPMVEIGYNDIASVGIDGVVRDHNPNGFTATACHKGLRRSPAAARMLQAASVPVSNILRVLPSINYEDFISRSFRVDRMGLSVPGKTDYAFNGLMLFMDDSEEEKKLVKRVRAILDVEAIGILSVILLTRVRDDEGLLGLG